MVASLPWSAGNTNPVLRYRLSQRCRDHCWSHGDRACTSVQNIILNHSGTVKPLRHPEMRKDRSTTEKKPKERSCVTCVLQRFQTTSLVSRAGWLFLSPNCSFRGKPWASDSEPRCGRRRASLPPPGPSCLDKQKSIEFLAQDLHVASCGIMWHHVASCGIWPSWGGISAYIRTAS